jgi:hypothetical protein
MREYRNRVHIHVDGKWHAIHKIPLKYSSVEDVRADNPSITKE